MNTEKIKTYAKKLREEKDNLIFIETEISDLLLAIADYIIKDAQDCHLDALPKGYVTLKQFQEEYFFIGATTLHDYCKNNENFRERCAKFYDGMWYVSPTTAAQFFYAMPIYKNRMDRIMAVEKKSVSSNK